MFNTSSPVCRVILPLTLLFTLSGCTHHYTPNASTFKLDSITEFTSKSNISLVNAQSSTEDVLFAENAGHEFYGKFQDWTDTAVEITQRELTKRGMTVVSGAKKSLSMSVEDVKVTVGFWAFRSITTVKVRTGEGYVR